MANEIFGYSDLPPSAPNEPKRVARTGLAVVHEGELVFPAENSEAEMVALDAEDRAVVVYYPVHVEIRMAEFDSRKVDAMIRTAFERFTDHIDGTVVV
jgi:hypothetical protein